MPVGDFGPILNRPPGILQKESISHIVTCDALVGWQKKLHARPDVVSSNPHNRMYFFLLWVMDLVPVVATCI